jgi:hypothetical protein
VLLWRQSMLLWLLHNENGGHYLGFYWRRFDFCSNVLTLTDNFCGGLYSFLLLVPKWTNWSQFHLVPIGLNVPLAELFLYLFLVQIWQKLQEFVYIFLKNLWLICCQKFQIKIWHIQGVKHQLGLGVQPEKKFSLCLRYLWISYLLVCF